MTEDIDTLGPRKGRSNAIITYETIAEVSNKLTRVETLLEGMAAQHRDAEKAHLDHEVRLRTLEGQVTTLLASTGATKHTWLYVQTLLFALPSLVTSIISLVVLIRAH